MKLFKIGIFSVLSLVGCNSFNVIEINPITFVPIPVQRTKVVVEKTTTEPVKKPEAKQKDLGSVLLLCPEYKFVTTPHTPDLPIKEIYAIPANDPNALNRLLLKHIDELRIHISKLKNQAVISKDAYLIDCLPYREKSK